MLISGSHHPLSRSTHPGNVFPTGFVPAATAIPIGNATASSVLAKASVAPQSCYRTLQGLLLHRPMVAFPLRSILALEPITARVPVRRWLDGLWMAFIAMVGDIVD